MLRNFVRGFHDALSKELCHSLIEWFESEPDVRTDEEFEDSHIPDSKLLNIRDPQLFMDGIQKLDKNKNYYVYCHSGVRSVQACQIMKTFGINNVYNLLGGISEWGGELVKD